MLLVSDRFSDATPNAFSQADPSAKSHSRQRAALGAYRLRRFVDSVLLRGTEATTRTQGGWTNARPLHFASQFANRGKRAERGMPRDRDAVVSAGRKDPPAPKRMPAVIIRPSRTRFPSSPVPGLRPRPGATLASRFLKTAPGGRCWPTRPQCELDPAPRHAQRPTHSRRQRRRMRPFDNARCSS